MSEMDEPLEGSPGRPRLVPEELQNLVDEKPRRRRLEVEGRAVAAPPPRGRVLDQPRVEGVPEDVRDPGDQMRRAGELRAAWAVAEEMVGATVTPIRPPRVVPVQLLKAVGEALLVRAEDDVMVVRHQAPREDLPFERRGDTEQLLAKGLAVVVVPNDPPTIAAATGHVVDALGIYGSVVAAHASIVAEHVSRSCPSFVKVSDTGAWLRWP